MDLSKRMNDISNKLQRIKNYDANIFVINLENMVNSLSHFYNVIAVNAKSKEEASYVKYDIPKKFTPQRGQIAYFNLGRGYPKELEDGHWCYIYKDCGNHFIVIPTTSIKDKSYKMKNNELRITIKEFVEDGDSRLRIEHIRAIDKMRLYKTKGVYNVLTAEDDINKAIDKILFNRS